MFFLWIDDIVAGNARMTLYPRRQAVYATDANLLKYASHVLEGKGGKQEKSKRVA